MRKKVLLIKGDSSGCFPVPATRGGAVQKLIEQIISENEKRGKLDIEVVSYFEEAAQNKAETYYSKTVFHWVKQGVVVKSLDKLSFAVLSKLIGRNKAKSGQSIFSAIKFICFSTLLLRKNTYDTVILENYIPLGWIIKLSKYKGKYYFHLHNFPRTNGKCAKVLKKCDGYLCVSQFIADQLTNGNTPIGTIPKDKVFTLLNGIDTEIFREICDDALILNKRKQYDIKENEKVLLFAGRICKEKGIDVLIKAISEMDLSNIKLVIAGGTNFTISVEDDYSVYLHKLVEPIKNRVVFTGYIEHNEMGLLYNIADIVILPSVAVEACTLTVGEAISCGKPVITTNTGGIPEIADNCAYVLEVNDDLSGNIRLCIEELLHTDSKVKIGKMTDYREKHSIYRFYEEFVSIVEAM